MLRGAVIGVGFIARHGHLPAYALREDVEIVALCDLVPLKAELNNKAKYYQNYKDLFEQEKNLDFVDIATNAANHHEVAKFFLEKGIHTLCEKPLTTSSKDAEELLSIAKKNNCIYFPCHNYKHAPVVKKIREIIESKKIGDIHSVSLQTFRNTHAKGVSEWKPDWRRFTEYSGGGIAMDHGSHGLYLIFEWLKSYPTSVTAFGYNLQNNLYDTEDNFTASYQFPTGTAHIYLTWTAGVRKVVYSLQGTKGAIKVEDDDVEIAILHEDDNEKSSHKAWWDFERFKISSDWMDSSHTTWFNSMFDGFLKAIQEKDIENHEIKDALMCIKSIEKAYESIREKSILKNI